MRYPLIALFVCAACLSAADFQDFQAARAVIGQPSFSSHDKTIMPRALSLSKNTLYVADAAGKLFSYDLSQIGIAKTPGCPVCLSTPQSTTQQNVFEGVSKVAAYKDRIAVADSQAHRVLLWKGSPSSAQPDLVLTGFKDPTSVALDDRSLFIGDAATHHVYIWNSIPVSELQPPDVTLGSLDASSDGTGPDTVQTPAALLSDGTNLYVADSASQRVLVFTRADFPAPRVINAATLLPGPFAPGTLVTLQGVGASGSTVFLNGNLLPVTESDGGEAHVQIPFDLATSSAASLWSKSTLDNGASGFSASTGIRITTSSPGIFAFGVVEPRTGLLLHSSVSVPLSPEDPAKPSEVLTVWATGLGPVSSETNEDGAFNILNPVHASINGSSVEVVSAELPADSTGVYEVRLRLPAQLPGSPTLVLVQSDARSNAVVFPVAQNSN